jgi:hypothetical protein
MLPLLNSNRRSDIAQEPPSSGLACMARVSYGLPTRATRLNIRGAVNSKGEPVFQVTLKIEFRLEGGPV